MSKSPIVVKYTDFQPDAIRYMQPKISDRGAKSVNVISNQSGRALYISTPLLMTWGISDYVDDKGESDNKFNMSLVFPNADYETEQSTEFLSKLKCFEEQILSDAVKNSEVWWGKKKSREVIEDNFFPFLKYPKDKLTGEVDMTRAPSMRAKVPNYDGRWNIEIYDTSNQKIFPCDNENLTPMDFVPKKSNVACVLQCGGLWFGGKGWGMTWRLNQCVVKPHIQETVFGKCHIELSNDDKELIEKQPIAENVNDSEDEEGKAIPAVPVKETTNTQVEDTDDESEEEPEPEPEPEPTPKKKVVRKKAESTADSSEPEPAPKKKVVRKKAA
tara:strand:+ start:1686 stop:2672 length:987 start_codon:yes stop_codon:yes gene_type:complete